MARSTRRGGTVKGRFLVKALALMGAVSLVKAIRRRRGLARIRSGINPRRWARHGQVAL
jgi:hypothetical protein